MNSMMKSLVPSTGGGDGGIIQKVIKALKMLRSIFKKTSKEAGNMDSVNNQSSLENIDRVTQIFSEFKEQVHVKGAEVEHAVGEEVDYYVEELYGILQGGSDRAQKYGIRMKWLERQIDKIASKVKGRIDSELSKKVSLDNRECKEIIKMIPGSKKEQAMEAFLNESVKNALEACCEEIHSSLAEIYEDVETEIVGAVEFIQRQNTLCHEKLCAIDKDNYMETATKQITDAYYFIDICNLIEKIL